MQSNPTQLSIPQAIQLAIQNKDAGNLQQAEALCWQVLEVDERNIDALHLLAILASMVKKWDIAMELVQKAIGINPNSAALYIDLGNIHFNHGQNQQALQAYEKAVSLDPNSSEVYNNLGAVLAKQGRFDEAVQYLRRAIALKPDALSAHHNIGKICHEQYRLNEALDAYKHVINLKPDFYECYTDLGNVYRDMGNESKAIENYQIALRIQPGYLPAKWGVCIAQLPMLYTSEAEIKVARRSYEKALQDFTAELPLETQEDIQAATSFVGINQPFYLAYQGLDDRSLQVLYAQLISRILRAKYPDWSMPLSMPSLKPDEKIRVGIVSRHFFDHSNWKMPIRGWVQNLNRKQFQVMGYSTGGPSDNVTVMARQLFDSFVANLSFEHLCEKIRSDNLHIVIFPEIGMDPISARMAALRLAPAQCTSWGHPDTSGLDSIDYYLSSDLMESEIADEYYSESLIRLPNLSTYYSPVQYDRQPLDLSLYGITDKDVLYVCCQFLPKYLPQYDFIYPKIAQQVPNAKFLFIGHPVGVSDIFRHRLKRAFAEEDLNALDHVVILPYLDRPHFASLCYQGHVFLDSIGWSGCNSTLEAVEYSLPVVTLPGEFMRGRHSTAILKMMDMTETIADSLEHYIDIAARLGNEPEWRAQVSQGIQQKRDRLYYDMESIHAFEKFLENCVKQPVSTSDKLV